MFKSPFIVLGISIIQVQGFELHRSRYAFSVPSANILQIIPFLMGLNPLIVLSSREMGNQMEAIFQLPIPHKKLN